jgi:transcriptional regulator with XRE-family HTH domain
VRDLDVGRLLRMLRIRRGWRLRDVAVRCGLSPATIGRTELGSIQSVAVLRAHAAVLDLRVEIRVVGRGTDVARLLDEEHAAIVESLARNLMRAGWAVEAEASYSEYGERGRIDLLAFHAASATLAVVEVKTELADLQDLFGSLDVKVRLAPRLGVRKGWRASRVVSVLAVAVTAANQSVVGEHPALFSSLARQSLRDRGFRARDQERVLLWVPASAAGRRTWLAGRRRVRPRRSDGPRS